jgi:hypothetical protein
MLPSYDASAGKRTGGIVAGYGHQRSRLRRPRLLAAALRAGWQRHPLAGGNDPSEDQLCAPLASANACIRPGRFCSLLESRACSQRMKAPLNSVPAGIVASAWTLAAVLVPLDHLAP